MSGTLHERAKCRKLIRGLMILLTGCCVWGFGRFAVISVVCVVGMALGSRLAIGVISKRILVFSDLGWIIVPFGAGKFSVHTVLRTGTITFIWSHSLLLLNNLIFSGNARWAQYTIFKWYQTNTVTTRPLQAWKVSVFKTSYSFGTCTRYMNNEGGFGHTNTVLAHDLPCLPHLSS